MKYLLTIFLFIGSSFLAHAQWNAMGPNQNELIMCLEFDAPNNTLLVGTVEGFWYYNLSSSTWTQREDLGWIGRTVHSIASHPAIPGRIITGRENAFFKGYMEYSNDWGLTNNHSYNSQGGGVTDVKNVPGSPDVFFATTWSDISPGELLKSTNGGVSWTLQSNYIHTVLTEIRINPGNPSVMYISGDALVTKSTNGGTSWAVQANGLPSGLGVYCLAMNPSNPEVLLASNDNGIYRTTNGGANWSQVHSSSSRHIEFNPVNSNIAAAITFAPYTVLLSTDAGASWQNLTGNYAGSQMRDLAFSGDGNTLYVASREQGVFWRDITSFVPVELTAFTVTSTISGVQLSWRTISELNNSHFEIEKSIDGVDFTAIGTVAGSGTTTEPRDYTYTDKERNAGTYYYRLRQVDNDGSFSFSEVVSVDISINEFSLFQNYPNPFNPRTVISYQLPEKTFVSLKVFNVLGKEIATLVNSQQDAGFFEISFDASSLPAGTYICRLQTDNFVQTRKMIYLK